MNRNPCGKSISNGLFPLFVVGFLFGAANAPAQTFFSPGNLVISVEGNGVIGGAGSYTHNQAAPLTLFQYTPNGTSSVTYVNSLVLPQTASGSNFPVSDEYGSTSESSLALTGNGQYLTIMGYGINASTFNANYANYSSDADSRLAQSGSLTGQSYTPVARVVAVIDGNGNVNSSTGLFNVFDQNNPRSVYSADGTSFYVSGQGSQVTPDATGGVFYTTLGSFSATAITAGDAGSGTSQDTRSVQIYSGQLYVCVDSKVGATNRSYVGTLGTGNPTSGSLAPVQLNGFGSSSTGKLTLATGQTNGINSVGQQINLSPQSFFFANATTLYVADTGSPHQTSATSPLGDGGLQKWSVVGGTWQLDYTLAQGLNLVQNSVANPSDTSGTTGLRALTGTVVGNQVYLYATNYTIGDLDQTYLYGITDSLSATSGSQVTGESFTQLATAPSDSKFMGVSFAPTTAPETWRLKYFNTFSNTGNSADTADPYNKGIQNLAVFAFLGPNQNPALAQVSQLPQPQISGGNFVYSFTQPAEVSGVTYGAQYTTSLSPTNWQPITDTGTGNQHIFSAPIGSNKEMFVRLTVTER